MKLRVLALVFLVACGGAPRPNAGPPAPAPAKILVNVDAEGVGLGGHDPVAYATANAAVPGTPQHTAQHGGATYRFASAEHKATFDGAAATHAPQYGGYCAYAAAMNRVSPADPTVFRVYDGQLLVFTNADFKARFNEDAPGHKRKADANWPTLVDKHGTSAK